jgi:hypothetical protein
MLHLDGVKRRVKRRMFKEALSDAEGCLKEDPVYHKAIFLKAEALYAQGIIILTFRYVCIDS